MSSNAVFFAWNHPIPGREGLSAEDDKLPSVFHEAVGSGPHEGAKAIDREELSRAVSLFYEMAGWDDQGVPRPGKLAELGIAPLA